METALIIVGVLVAILAVLLLFGQPLLRWLQRKQAKQAFEQFRVQREQLEAKFFDLASRLGKPRDLRWLDCDWQSGVTFGRDVQTGMLTAFVAVNIRFEAVEGGDMEFVEAVGLLRDAAAVFHYQHGCWGTGGRALFNMNPADALNRLSDQYEPVEAG
ncbi:hypothetical protein GC176_05305 [bacterium]|nr:hypothetical protein [bacterium]